MPDVLNDLFQPLEGSAAGYRFVYLSPTCLSPELLQGLASWSTASQSSGLPSHAGDSGPCQPPLKNTYHCKLQDLCFLFVCLFVYFIQEKN